MPVRKNKVGLYSTSRAGNLELFLIQTKESPSDTKTTTTRGQFPQNLILCHRLDRPASQLSHDVALCGRPAARPAPPAVLPPPPLHHDPDPSQCHRRHARARDADGSPRPRPQHRPARVRGRADAVGQDPRRVTPSPRGHAQHPQQPAVRAAALPGVPGGAQDPRRGPGGQAAQDPGGAGQDCRARGQGAGEGQGRAGDEGGEAAELEAVRREAQDSR